MKNYPTFYRTMIANTANITAEELKKTPWGDYVSLEDFNRVKNLVSWYLTVPAEDYLWATTFTAEDFEDFKLPYPCMVLEIESFAVSDGQGHDLTVAAILSEGEVEGERLLRIIPMGRFSIKRLGRDQWYPLGLMITMDDTILKNTVNWMKLEGPESVNITFSQNKDPLAKHVEPMVQMIDFYPDNPIWGAIPPLELQTMQHMVLSKITTAVIRLSIVLNCENAPVEHIYLDAINANRRKKGRPELPPYNILKITPPNDNTTRNHLGGTHASPREHLRRGHFRMVPTKTGRIRRWVEPTVVNPGNGTLVPETIVI